MFESSPSQIRFWTNTFDKYIKPIRTKKGDRLYRVEDIAVLKEIFYLAKKQKMTLDGVKAKLAEDRKSVESRVKAIDSLKEIRAQLEEIRKTL